MNAVVKPVRSPLERLRTLFEAVGPTLPGIEARRAAFDAFATLGLPTTRDESWKYTNLRRFESRPFELPIATNIAPLPAPGVLPEFGLRWVSVNGHITSAAAPISGIHVRTLASVLHQHPDSGSELLAGASADASHRFALLNQAFAADGLVIDIDPETAIEEPLQLIFVATGPGSPLIAPRVIVRAGARSRVRLIEQYLSSSGSQAIVNAVTRVQLERGAVIEHYRLQQEDPQTIHFGHVSATVGNDAKFISHNATFGAGLARFDMNVTLAAAGAVAELDGIFFGRGTQHMDHRTCVDHAALHTRSREDYRGIADDRSRGIFNGRIIVRPGADKTDAQMSSRNLLLANTAEIDTRPELEIYADDVRCSHGATTGQLDATALFYLRSRGIALEEARTLLILAFLSQSFEGVALAPVREHLQRVVREKFGGQA